MKKSKISQKKLLTLLRFARKKIHVLPPGLENTDITKWAIEVSKVLPEFPHFEGQTKANRDYKESNKELDYLQ
jgi:hypothetical protein